MQHTDLDFSVLGVIARKTAVTAYGVRKEFANSPVPAWSSSAGSVYPAIKRLRASRFVEPGEVTDARGRQQLSVTSRGRDALRTWLLSVAGAPRGPIADPIRTRVQFIEALPRAEQLEFVRSCVAATSAALKTLQERTPDIAQLDRGERLALKGATAELEARIAWLESVHRDSSAG